MLSIGADFGGGRSSLRLITLPFHPFDGPAKGVQRFLHQLDHTGVRGLSGRPFGSRIRHRRGLRAAPIRAAAALAGVAIAGAAGGAVLSGLRFGGSSLRNIASR
jgi:hypothetical protein